jgi:hypothetical protein
VRRKGTRSGTVKVSAYINITITQTYFLEQAVEINVDCVSGDPVEKYVLAMAVTETTSDNVRLITHPKTCPIIDMTASVRQ